MQTKGVRRSKNVVDRRVSTARALARRKKADKAHQGVIAKHGNPPKKAATNKPSYAQRKKVKIAQDAAMKQMARDLYDDDPEVMAKKRQQYDARAKFMKKRGDFG